jgi:hypothetical protein
MRRSTVILAATLGLISSALATNLREAVDGQNKKIEHAYLKMDAAAFEKALRPNVTANFKYTENGKSMGFDEMVSTVKHGFVVFAKMRSSRSKTVKLTSHGHTGEAVTGRRFVATLKCTAKKPYVMAFDGFTDETFRKEDGQWKLASMSWTKSDMTMDGKPYKPMKAAGAGR